MDAPLAKKTCKMCYMEIPQQARKCAHCDHFQNRWSMVMFHPAFAVVFGSLPIAVMLIVFATIFDTGENYETYKDQIVITDSQIVFGDMKAGATVAVIGTIKNASQVCWKEIQLSHYMKRRTFPGATLAAVALAVSAACRLEGLPCPL